MYTPFEPTSTLVYIAGPLTHGDRELNVQLAFEAASHLLVSARDRGLVVSPVVPHAYARCHAIYPLDYEDWMRADFGLLEACDAVLRLPGYSPGADREVAYAAEHVGIPVFYSVHDIVDWIANPPPTEEDT